MSATATKPTKVYHVTLTPEERAELERMTRVGTGAAAKLAKARVLLLADEAEGGPGWSDGRIVEAVGVSKNTVCRARERFVEEGVEAAIARKPPARTYARKLDGRGEARLAALACSGPPEGRAKWTLQLLADRMVALRCRTRRSGRRLKKRDQAVAEGDVVPAAEGGRVVRRGHGGRPRRVRAAARPIHAGRLPGRGEQAAGDRGPRPAPVGPGQPGQGGRGVRPQRDGQPVHGHRAAVRRPPRPRRRGCQRL